MWIVIVAGTYCVSFVLCILLGLIILKDAGTRRDPYAVPIHVGDCAVGVLRIIPVVNTGVVLYALSWMLIQHVRRRKGKRLEQRETVTRYTDFLNSTRHCERCARISRVYQNINPETFEETGKCPFCNAQEVLKEAPLHLTRTPFAPLLSRRDVYAQVEMYLSHKGTGARHMSAHYPVEPDKLRVASPPTE